MNHTTAISVLIVDDDPTIAALLKGVVRNLGGGFTCETVCAASGAETRAELARREFQLVLLDYLLPDEDGLSLLLLINKLPPGLRPVVIMLTGGGNEQVAVEAMKLGAKDYIVKTGLSIPALRHSIVSALERHRLEEELARSTEELRQKNAQLQADLVMARGIQQALLPRHYPVLPAGAPAGGGALGFCHRWIPSEKVAGDYFDVFPVTDTAAGLFICDVMGHGVRAALVTALVRGLLREHREAAARPAEFLGRVNRGMQALLGQSGDLVFVTALYLVVDAAGGAVRLANAGHPAPFCLRRHAGLVEVLASPDGPGSALGLLPGTLYEEMGASLSSGDALVMFTDGLHEAMDAGGQEFGQERVRATLRAGLSEKTSVLVDRLLDELKGFRPAGAAGFDDDICVFAVDYAPPT